MTIIHEHDLSAELCTDPAQLGAQPAQFNAPPVQVEVVTEINHPAPYTSHELADELGIAESTLRTRWLPWITKVAPIELLVTEAGYTELARSLFSEFSQLSKKKAARERWVGDAKTRYSREFMPGGITPEGVPDELGSALALLQNRGNVLQSTADDQLQRLQQLIESQAQVEAEFDEAEIAAIRAAGMKRGALRFQIEAEAEDSAYYGLRKARAQARNPQPGKP